MKVTIILQFPDRRAQQAQAPAAEGHEPGDRIDIGGAAAGRVPRQYLRADPQVSRLRLHDELVR